MFLEVIKKLHLGERTITTKVKTVLISMEISEDVVWNISDSYSSTCGLKAKLRLLKIPTDPRYWVMLTGISKHVKNL